MLQITLACIPTLTPLFTYFREKSTARYGYSSNTANTRDQNHSLNILKSRPGTRVTEASSDGWKDDPSDTGSQHGILRPEASWTSNQVASSEVRGQGIMATTRVEVHISAAEDGDREMFRQGGNGPGSEGAVCTADYCMYRTLLAPGTG